MNRGHRGGPSRGRGFDDRGRGRGGGGRGGGRGPAEIFQADVPPRVDARINTSDELVNTFKKLAVSNEKPLRPGYGTLGRPITLRANFFAVRLPKAPIFDYSVDITPAADVKSQSMRSRVLQLLEQSPQMTPYRGHIAHDKGGRLVSARLLEQPLNVQISYHDEGEPLRPDAKTMNIEINFIRELDSSQLTRYLAGSVEDKDKEYDPLPIISALNLVLQQHASTVAVRFGRNRYFFPQAQHLPTLSPALDAWRGYYTSVRPVYKQLMVNVNVCMTAFSHGGSLMDALNAFRERSRGASPSAFPQKFKVVTNHLGHPMKKQLKKVLGTNPTNTFFDCAEFGGRISVAQYFKRKYNIILNPGLPVIDVGGANKQTYLPAEICTVAPNQPYTGRLTDTETAQMIRVACNSPATNADLIVNEGLGQLGFPPPLSPINAFGIQIETQMAVVPARILQAPRLSYLGNNYANAQNGSWNILNVKFQRPGTLGQWMVVVVQDFGKSPFQGPQDPTLRQLTDGFWTKLKTSGIDAKFAPLIFPTPHLPPPGNDPNRQKAIDIISQTIKKAPAKPSLILFLLSGRDDFIYPGIKKLCDTQLGVASICMQLSKAIGDPRKQDQYFSNVALKVNTKLGGVNHLVDESAMKWLKEKSTMMVGMDVTHPGPNSIPGTPSVAAVVASTDNTFSQFPVSLRLQETKVEMIQELTQMMIERLQVYKSKNRSYPERVLVYRDGVSEGQFDAVLKDELPGILDAFKKLGGGGKPYSPKLTIMICGKRHHARFYPTKSGDAAQNGNTLPGTVVDKGVTSVYTFDFYLQAHAGLQGTVRPTHYTVVYDENRLDADTIQQGTHTASYLYVRATKAVSLVPAAYYADLACERARCYINRLFVASESDKASSTGGKRDKEAEKKRVFEEAQRIWGVGVHEDLKGTMFYI